MKKIFNIDLYCGYDRNAVDDIRNSIKNLSIKTKYVYGLDNPYIVVNGKKIVGIENIKIQLKTLGDIYGG